MRYFHLFSTLLTSAALLMPVSASAWVPDTPLTRARAHCRMMLASLQDMQPQTSEEVLDIIGKDNWAGVAEAERIMTGWKAGYNIVDMRFLVGRRWDTLTREQRFRFGRALSRLLLQSINTAPTPHYDGMCAGKESQDADLLFRVESFVLDRDNKPVPIIYLYKKTPEFGLMLEDIILHETRLSESFTQSYKGLMQKESVEEILTQLEGMTGIKPPEASV